MKCPFSRTWATLQPMEPTDAELDEVRVFLALVREGSLLAAANALDTSRSRVKRKLDRLEARVGVPLLNRGPTGHFEPTLAGQALADGAPGVLQQVDNLLTSVREVGTEPAGAVTVAVPIGMSSQNAATVLLAFHRRLPRVRVRVRRCERPAELLPAEADIAMTFAGYQPQIPVLVTDILSVRVRAVASPAYLEEHGVPRRVQQLHRHTLSSWAAPYSDPERWPLLRGGHVQVQPLAIDANMAPIRQIAIEGGGICLVPDVFPLAPAPLVHVLPGSIGAITSLQLIVPKVLVHVPAVAALVDLARQYAVPPGRS